MYEKNRDFRPISTLYFQYLSVIHTCRLPRSIYISFSYDLNLLERNPIRTKP